MAEKLQSSRVRIEDSPRAIQNYFWEQSWTDGLPIVAPTEPLVREMLSGYGGQPSDSLGRIQPGNSNVTLEKLAVNAVMAGCLPEHFPVVVAALKAALRDEFNLAGNAVTTGGAAQVLIVNGPIAKELEINGDAACFGPGYRANAVIGRALRLAVRNLGGLIPGDMDKATLSTPYRYSFCFSENEDQSPWEPRHVELGYKPEASTVTIAAILGVYNVMESTVGTGLEVLRTITANMRGVGIPGYYHLGTRSQIVLVLCPEHANEIAGSGLSKADVREYIYANARMPIHQLKDLAHYGNRVWPNWIDQTNANTLVPICASPDDIVVVVAGGGGRHSAWMSGWVTRVCSEEIWRAE
ncbi:MAG: hypothetical protein FI705_04150 [SAR202 cluster bacterium]|uniref:Uncharacterized protein n=1 Tax=hydrothermal vent metagenome TaxID=652676 RepID=A0A160VAC5_9ZZZZ|nr:hypothetical protein [Dehalococcoidia bacterium]MQG65304.1 hypothetical protein [SAR202 cluster bacterium]MQG71472.1 hypothetical protein [SAR202 cluster bacterium]|tara:strand:- start:87 stop:1148 length:1062 start_codon:yes stop_codon:yes gene_type:complete